MLHLRLTPRHGAWFVVLLCLAATFLSPTPASAQSAETYTVRDVPVDVRADNVSVARDRALLEGQRAAYQTLMQRLTSPADWPRLPRVSDNDLQNMVLDVGIDQEKRSDVRYLATLSVRFKPDAVRRLLRNANIAYAEWRGRPVVVVPVYQSDAGPVIGQANDPWRDAWKSGAAQGVVPLAVPTPEQISSVLTPVQAAAAAPDAVTALTQRFNVQDAVIAVATPHRLDGGKASVDVALSGTGPVGGLLSGTRSYTGEAGESLDLVMRHAVEDLAKTVNDGWKSGGNMLQFDRSASLAVVVPIANLEDWMGVREKLAHTSPVRSYEVEAMSKAEAALTLHYVGDQQQLESTFVQNGLALTWAGDHWVLSSATARPNAGAQ